jgi:DNA-binding SARP family transcriptional activator
MDEAEREATARMRLRLTTREWRAFDLLTRREAVSAEALVSAVWGSYEPANPTAALSSLIMNLRSKLRVQSVEVKSLWGFGYGIPPEGRTRLRDWLAQEA